MTTARVHTVDWLTPKQERFVAEYMIDLNASDRVAKSLRNVPA
jgi:hypothetical protein